MMTRVVVIQEGTGVPLSELEHSNRMLLDREKFRLLVSAHGRRLRRQLGLRENAVAVEDGPNGPELQARGIAGTFSMGTLTFDVAPKYVSSAADVIWQQILMTMFERVSGKRWAFSESRPIKEGPGSFMDQLAASYALELERATNHSEVRWYRSTVRELSQVRGRLLVTEQLRSSMMKPHKVICEVDELSSDNSLNSLLHWALREMASRSTLQSIRRRLNDLSAKLPPVSEPVRRPTRLSIQLPRQYHHYDGAVALALILARGTRTLNGQSDLSGANFLVGTERLFEAFVDRSLESALRSDNNWAVSAQERSLFASPVEPVNYRRAYYSKPDNLVRQNGRVQLIVDAKYKQFVDSVDESVRGRPTSGDLYQLAAACVAHGCSRALILYPSHDARSGAGPWAVDWWSIRFDNRHLFVGAASLPLGSATSNSSLTEFDLNLRNLVQQAARKDFV